MSAASHPNGAIPIVDISPLLLRNDVKGMKRALRRMRKAARETGLFYLEGHQTPLALLRRVYLSSLCDLELGPEFKIGLSTKEGGHRYIANRKGIFAGRCTSAAEECALPLVEHYYDRIFDLCRSLLERCAMALEAPVDLFQGVLASPVLHGRLLHHPPSASIQDGDMDEGLQPYGSVVIPWTQEVDAIRLDDDASSLRPLPARGRLNFRVADAMARLSTDLHISAPHRLIDESGRETYLIPVFHGSENNIRLEWSTHCFLTEQPDSYSRVYDSATNIAVDCTGFSGPYPCASLYLTVQC
ncbi:2-oxoglutarate and iron-dependent oxygenase domain-containing protein [Bordetella sp. H567]|uniref:2-oxoglutarate and iron-dependent oxygenase domain-containing protein n=1 Tax=Bordetella sp. H567 TaxID=1697043 RepID=UPI000976B5D2|nr:2-oxoglutarate and iron-dependent oxygenase domain-containing protein [Bordetella sp. H567]